MTDWSAWTRGVSIKAGQGYRKSADFQWQAPDAVVPESNDAQNDIQPGYRHLSQAKVVLLGDVGAGKTSFLNALRYGQARLAPGGPAGRTIGIEVHSVDLDRDARLWFYDFGGHETYHFSQGLFLTEKAIYMLMVDIASYNTEKFGRCVEYWYTVLTSQLVSPIICVVATHTDQCAAEQVTRRCQSVVEMLYNLEMRHLTRIRQQLERINADIQASIQGKADPVYDFQANSLKQPREKLESLLKNRPRVHPTICKVSSKTLDGIPIAARILLDVVRNNSESFPPGMVAESWLKMGDSLAAKREELPFMRWAHFQALAKDHGVDHFDIKQCLKYLQTTGIILHYEDFKKQSELREMVFNNTNLLLSIFGLIFNHNYYNDEMRYIWHNRAMHELPREDMEVLQRNLRTEGIIGEKLLRCFWASLGLTDDVIHAMMSLLEKFDLCYEVSLLDRRHRPDGRHFRFPYLLKSVIPLDVESMWPKRTPPNFTEYQLMLCLEADRMPIGFLEKVSVRINPYLDARADWKSGIVSLCNGGEDVIKLEAVAECGISTSAAATTSLLLQARVRQERRDMARHILLLMVAVINKVLLRQYPGIVGYWYVGCAHCIALKQRFQGIAVDLFPADNLVFTMTRGLTVVCRNCGDGQVLQATEVFPTLADAMFKTEKMNAAERQALKASLPRLIDEVDARQLLTVLLKRGVIDLRQAEDVASQRPNNRRMEKLLKLLVLRGHRAFEGLCHAVRTDGECPELAAYLEKEAGMATEVPIEKVEARPIMTGGNANTLPPGRQQELSARHQAPSDQQPPERREVSSAITGGDASTVPRGYLDDVAHVPRRESDVDEPHKGFPSRPHRDEHTDHREDKTDLPADVLLGDVVYQVDEDVESVISLEDARNGHLKPVFYGLAWRIFCLVGARTKAEELMGMKEQVVH